MSTARPESPLATGNGAAAPVTTGMRAWKVLHACEYLRDVAATVEAQLAAGMRPLVVTPYATLAGERALAPDPADLRPVSLLSAWHNVRLWRQSMLDADPLGACDLVHAHSFASGMAAVRNCPAVVYDVSRFVEDTDPTVSHQGAWLKRSFRVAEQFIFARAGAVVVHSERVKAAAVERGAPGGNLFVVPPAITDAPENSMDAGWLRSAGLSGRSVVYVDVSGAGDDHLRVLLEAFAALRRQFSDAVLLAGTGDAGAFPNVPGAHVVAADDAARALAAADVVVALTGSGEPALQALLHGRALLAADCAAHRELSAQGRGLLWFGATDAADLANRLEFLLRTADFRLALAAAGRQHLLETRSPAAVGERYDAVYRHAVARRRTVSPPAPGLRLHPLEASC